jgi:hypothetical protein
MCLLPPSFIGAFELSSEVGGVCNVDIRDGEVFRVKRRVVRWGEGRKGEERAGLKEWFLGGEYHTWSNVKRKAKRCLYYT